MSLRGLFVGVVALAFLERVLSDQAAAGRVGGMLTAIGATIQHLLDPSIPLVPDLRAGASNSGGTAQSGQTSPPPSPSDAAHRSTTTIGAGRAVHQP